MTSMFSRIGLGAGDLGAHGLDDSAAQGLVHGALDAGVTVFDSARSYGASEERLGRALAGRRDVSVMTKGGYGVDGVGDWTFDAVRLGVDQALARLGRDQLEVFFLHSCDRATLERGEVVGALTEARRAGKIARAGYSGEGDALQWAATQSDLFQALECSLSPFDQANAALVADAGARGTLVVLKRALANAPWRFEARPNRDDVALYWDRMHAMAVDPAPLPWAELAVRFAAHAPGVTTALVGTTSLTHLRAALEAAAKGPLDASVADSLCERFAAVSHGAWSAVV